MGSDGSWSSLESQKCGCCQAVQRCDGHLTLGSIRPAWTVWTVGLSLSKYAICVPAMGRGVVMMKAVPACPIYDQISTNHICLGRSQAEGINYLWGRV